MDKQLEHVAWWLLTNKPVPAGLEGIASTMWANGYTVDEALEALRKLAGYTSGTITNPYLHARHVEGHPRSYAQTHAATAAFLETVEALGADFPGYDQIDFGGKPFKA